MPAVRCRLLVAVTLGAVVPLVSADVRGAIPMDPMTRLPLVLIPAYFVPAYLILHAVALLQARHAASATHSR